MKVQKVYKKKAQMVQPFKRKDVIVWCVQEGVEDVEAVA